jgi:hypothetical protein
MAATPGAMHFGPRHEQSVVLRGADRTVDGLEETRPSGAGLKLKALLISV